MTESEARKALEKRRANPPKQLSNDKLLVYEPMHFYCYSCGHVSDILLEGFFSKPSHLCKACRVMKEAGWLE